jgi:hypothetical protein
LKSSCKYILAFTFSFLIVYTAKAQQYPVQANLSIQAPLPNKLSGLFPLSNTRVNLSLLLTDFSQSEVQVRLSIAIEGGGLKIQTRNGLNMPVFRLQGGIPIVLGNELEPYFRSSNLIATGNNAAQFMQNGVLPEGFFTFTITVIEHLRNVPISNIARSFGWIVVNDPPEIVTPSNHQKIESSAFQNIFISWMPKHSLVQSHTNPINYTLSIWEVPVGLDPQVITKTIPPLESVITTSNSVVWGSGNTPLAPGKRYALTVKAADQSNEITFKNNGVSMPIVFVYGQECKAPINLAHTNVFYHSADIGWYALGGGQRFRVEFKPLAEPDDAWRSIETEFSKITLNNLAPETQYTYRIGSICGTYDSEPSISRTFKTLSNIPQDYTCSPDISEPYLDQSPLMSALTPGLVFTAGGFMVELREFKQDMPYTFSGLGFVTFPALRFAIKANLNKIKINHSLQMVDGTIEAIQGDGVNFVQIFGPGQTGPGAVDFSNANDTIHVNSNIESVYMNPDSTWTVVTEDGQSIVITPSEGGTVVVGPDGNGVVIVGDRMYPMSKESTGGGGYGGGTPITPVSICNDKVTFSPGGSMHRFGFDIYKEIMPPGSYHHISVGGETLHLPWKSVASGASDRLLASPKSPLDITFAYESGMPLQRSNADEGYHVWSANPPGGEDNLFAVCQADSTGRASIAGGVRVKAYDLKRYKLAIVPVGTSQPKFTRAELQSALNSIYSQAVVEWEVTFEQSIPASTILNYTNGLEVGETDYSEAMRSVMRAYVTHRNKVPGTIYLFIVSNFKDNPSMVGYMPLKSGYGFLTPQASPQVAAHELGHGVFNLRHTFSQGNIVNLPEGSTKNLMDYSTGTELFKYQWDFIHNPEGGLFIFEDSEEGAARMAGLHYKNSFLSDNQTLYFFPEKAQTLELVAGKITNAVLESEDVKWTHKGVTESEKSPSFIQNISIQYFADQDSVVVSGKQGYLIFLNIERKVILKKLSLNMSQEIEDYCNGLIDLRTQFDELQAQLERPDHIDPIVWKNSQSAYSRKMSALTTPQGEVNENDTFNQLLSQMHALDSKMEAIEDFDALYQEALRRRSRNALWDAFVQDVIGLLPYANPLNNRETLEEEMFEQLLIKTREVLLNPSGN